MTHSRGNSRLHALLVMVSALTIAACATCRAEDGDAAREALARHRFPWYDADADSFRPIRLRQIEVRDASAPSFPFVQIVMWGLLGVLLALAIYFFVRWGIDHRSSDQAALTGTADVEVDRLDALPEAARQVSDLLGHARQLAAQGRYSEAIVFLYGWQLVQLDRQGAIELQKGKTNHRYIDEVAGSKPELEPCFSRSTRVFEDAFFGNLEIAESAFRRVWDNNPMFAGSGAKGGAA